jgi:hypothetical protein
LARGLHPEAHLANTSSTRRLGWCSFDSRQRFLLHSDRYLTQNNTAMARGELMKKLLASYGRDDEFRAVAEQIIVEEE